MQILLNTLKVFICLPSPKIELTIFVILIQQNFLICTLYIQETFIKTEAKYYLLPPLTKDVTKITGEDENFNARLYHKFDFNVLKNY